MKKLCGNDFTEAVFSDNWKFYLSGYGITTIPDTWFLKTVMQAFDALTETGRETMGSFIITPVQNRLTPVTKQAPKECQLLFDNLIEPYFLRKFSVVIIKEILLQLIEIIKEREELYEAAKNVDVVLESIIAVQQNDGVLSAQHSLTSIDDPSVIDVTAEGQKLNFSSDTNDITSTNEEGAHEEYGQAYKLGNKYSKKLQLTEEEGNWLNKFWDPSNAFIAVEQCCIETIKLYLGCLKGINSYFNSRQSNLHEKVAKYTEGMVFQNKAALSDAYSINYFQEQAEATIYLTIFKKAENTVRDVYRHKRKINDSFSYNELAMSFERRFGKMAGEIIQHSLNTIARPDSETELQLNKMNTARWKLYFDEIVANINTENTDESAAAIDALAIANSQNPSLEYIYYDACKAFAGVSNLTAVKFYLKYIYADLHSEQINNKQLTKSIQKSLFSAAEQLQDFESIANKLIKTNNLSEALHSVENIYAKRRKKLQLDQNSIAQIKLQHQATVDRLNELLQDDEETEISINLTPAKETAIQPEQSVINTDTIATGITIIGLNLNDNQKELLLLFGENHFQVDAGKVDAYAKSKGVFKNALIERINDCCYDELDDVLIEETTAGYEVNEFYYNKIINIC